MRSVLALTFLAASAIAAPAVPTLHERAALIKRQTNSAPTDIEILNYALTLEHLEKNFYFQGLAKFRPADFTAAGFTQQNFQRVQTIAIQEKNHVSFLAGALGSQGVSECKYNFTTALSSVASFVATARVLEGVGTAAYLGAAPDISSDAYLSAAGSILTVEARHTAYLNEANGANGFPVTFETALNYAQVYSLAAPFIIPGTCGAAKALPSSLKVFPTLTFITQGPRSGDQSAIKFPKQSGKTSGYTAAFLNGGQTLYAPVALGSDGVDRVRVPAGLLGTGVTYVIITTSTSALSNENTVAGPALIFL